MYISRIHLCNWRSYADAEFDFLTPANQQPLVLIGAMNGHGKTSLLFALYVGLFGRFGLRHAEGFQAFDRDNAPHYREAIRQFRRRSSNFDDPSSVEIVFSPTNNDPGDHTPEIRVIRRWFFNSAGQPRPGDAFETVELFVDGRPQRIQDGVDSAIGLLERHLFQADVMPAFFFDGEQAQTLINNSGQEGMKKAVEVLFGTKIVEESLLQVKGFVQASHSKLGGKRNASAQQNQLDEAVDRREALERKAGDLSARLSSLERSREQMQAEQRHTQEQLARMGGEQRGDISKAHADVKNASDEVEAAAKALTSCVKSLGLALALSRLAPAILNRLEAEKAREQWENLRDGTVNRIDEVLSRALPEPPESDPLLGNLSSQVRDKIRDRFRAAIEYIYNPPPTGCASEYVLGHARGPARDRLLSAIAAARANEIGEIRGQARRLTEARQRLEDSKHKLGRIGNLPTEVRTLSEQLEDLGNRITDASRELGAADNEAKKVKSDLHDVNAQIGQLQEALAKLGPEQQRIAVAERLRAVLSDLSDQLRPITVQRLQGSVTSHFTGVADQRYNGGDILFPESGSPILRMANRPDALIERMSGFERRAFGISFSLALAEITRKRIPLVIDTPLGNADQDYRRRLLSALTNVDLDQVIILTHDAEVAGQLFEDIEPQVKQTFLVEFDQSRDESVVFPYAYFNGRGR